MLMAACRPNWTAQARGAASITNRLVSFEARDIERSATKANRPTISRQTTRPNSSPPTAKTKPVWASGS